MECGECTLCCKLLETHGISSEIGIYCEHCDSKKGCTIYSIRPEECSTYECMWLQMKHAGIELRPDKSHIIFDKINDRTICARQDPDYELSDRVLNQINRFNNECFSVVVLYKKQKKVSLSKGHIMEDIKRDIYDHS